MVRLETGHTPLSEVVKENRPSPDAPKNPPHGVAAETYGLLLYARDHKEILDAVDSLDKGKKIVNPTRNLLAVYFATGASLRDLPKFVGGDRITNGKRMLKALEVIWQHSPPTIQLQYPKEKAVRVKELPFLSPSRSKKLSDTTKAIWQDDDKRKELVEAVKRGVQRYCNAKYYAIEETADSSAKRQLLLDEAKRLIIQIGRSPTSPELYRLYKEGETLFSRTVYENEFSQKGHYREAWKKIESELLNPIITALAGPSFEAAQRLTGYLTSKSTELAKHGISEKDISKHTVQIEQACGKILSATSEQEVNQAVERLNLLLSRIKRKIEVMIPLSLTKGRLRLQKDIL